MSPFIGVALGVTAGVSLDIALILSAVVKEHSLLPLLESVLSVVQPSQNWVEHAFRVERNPTSLNTMISPSTVQASSAVRTEGPQARGGGEWWAPEGWVRCREGVGTANTSWKCCDQWLLSTVKRSTFATADAEGATGIT